MNELVGVLFLSSTINRRSQLRPVPTRVTVSSLVALNGEFKLLSGHRCDCPFPTPPRVLCPNHGCDQANAALRSNKSTQGEVKGQHSIPQAGSAVDTQAEKVTRDRGDGSDAGCGATEHHGLERCQPEKLTESVCMSGYFPMTSFHSFYASQCFTF